MTIKMAEMVFMEAALHCYEVLNLQIQNQSLYQFPLKSHEFKGSKIIPTGFWKIPLISYICSVSFKNQIWLQKVNNHYFHCVLLEAADLVRFSFQYSSNTVLQIYESNQKAILRDCFLLIEDLAEMELSKVAGSSTCLTLFCTEWERQGKMLQQY